MEAELVKRIADRLFARAEAADRRGNQREFEHCSVHFVHFKEHGYEPVRAKCATLAAVKKNGNERIHHEQRAQFERIFARAPDQHRPELSKRIEGIGKKGSKTGSKK